MIAEEPTEDHVKHLLTERMHTLVWCDTEGHVMRWGLYWNDDRQRSKGLHWTNHHSFDYDPNLDPNNNLF